MDSLDNVHQVTWRYCFRTLHRCISFYYGSSHYCISSNFDLLVVGCGSFYIQNWQARSCQMSFCCYWHLHWQEAWGYCSLFTQLWCVCSTLFVHHMIAAPFPLYLCSYLIIMCSNCRCPMLTAQIISLLTSLKMGLYVPTYPCPVSSYVFDWCGLILLHNIYRWVCSLTVVTPRMTLGSLLMRISLHR